MKINEIQTRMPLNQRPLSGKTLLRIEPMGSVYGLYDLKTRDLVGQIRNVADLDRILHRSVSTYHIEIAVKREVYNQDREFFQAIKKALAQLEMDGLRHYKLQVIS